MLKKILAGMIAMTAMLSFASCTENEDDDSSKATKKSTDSSVVVTEESSSKAEEETTTTTTTAATEQPTETETTTTTTAKTEEPEPSTPVTDGDVYEEDDFSLSIDSTKWIKYDAASVDGESVKETLGVDVGSFNTQINCLYTYVDDPSTTFNVVSTSVPGLKPDMDTSEFIDYFTQILGSASDKVSVESTESTKVGSNNAIHLKITVDAGNGAKILEEQYDIFGDGKMVAMTFTSSPDSSDDHAADFKAILDSLKIK